MITGGNQTSKSGKSYYVPKATSLLAAVRPALAGGVHAVIRRLGTRVMQLPFGFQPRLAFSLTRCAFGDYHRVRGGEIGRQVGDHASRNRFGPNGTRPRNSRLALCRRSSFRKRSPAR